MSAIRLAGDDGVRHVADTQEEVDCLGRYGPRGDNWRVEMSIWIRVIFGVFVLAATYARFGLNWIDSDDYLTIIVALLVVSGIAQWAVVRKRGR